MFVEHFDSLSELENFRTQVRAVRTYLFEEVRVNLATSTADHIVVTPEKEATDMQRCIELNVEWNASIAEIRNRRLEKEMNERQEYILSRLELKRQREEDARLAAEEMVRLEKVCFAYEINICTDINTGLLITGTREIIHFKRKFRSGNRIRIGPSSRL